MIDLAGDFRLAAEAYPRWYGFEHPAPAWLDEAVYGLPELFGDRVPGAKLVANPGCFATAAIMACAPILAAGLAEPGTIRVDGKTGVSGAGRAAMRRRRRSARPRTRSARTGSPRTSTRPRSSAGWSSRRVTPSRALFVPHLVPAVRGVVTTSLPRGCRGVDDRGR